MKFRVDLLTNIGPLEVTASLFDVTVERYSKRINAPGKMVFTIKATHPRATNTNLRPYRRVRLHKNDGTGFRACWFGFIQDTYEQDGRIEVLCVGMLGFFEKRFTAENEAFTGQGSTEAMDLLSACNTDDDTGVIAGTGGVTTTKDIEAQGRIDVLRAWELLAQAHEAEFEIDDDGEFNFVPSLGSDLTTSITIVYRRDGSPGNTASSIRIGQNGRDMATRVIGSSSTVVTPYIYESSTQATYGVITVLKAFNEAQDAGTLQSMTEAYGSQVEHPIPDFQVTPITARKVFNPRTGERVVKGLDYFDIPVGSLVSTQIITENQTITTAKRVAEIIVNVDENGHETLSFTLTEAGIYITAAYLDATRTSELSRRIQHIESLL